MAGVLRVLLAVLLLLPLASASEPYVTLLDWKDGASPVGAPLRVAPLSASFPIVVDDCHYEILVDLLYSPDNTTARADGVGSVTAPYSFRVDAVAPGGVVVASRTIANPGYGAPLGWLLPGEYDVRVQLSQGALVDWSLRVRGHEFNCSPPL